MPNIVLLSNVTLAGPFLLRALKEQTGCEVLVPPGFDTWRQCLLAPEAMLTSSDAVFLILDGRSLLGIDGLRDKAVADAILEDALQLLRNFTAAYADIPLFVGDIDVPPIAIRPIPQQGSELYAMWKWRTGLEEIGIPILNVAGLVADIGRNKFYSAATWYAGFLPYSHAGELGMSFLMAQMWHAFKGHRKKVLVLDLDNTLWGGVLGEDGLDGITLGADHTGAAYRDFQQCCLDLKKQGVLLAIVSKNNEADALECIRNHPQMVLREKDFVAIYANWEPKPHNIKRLSDELNLGLDAFVFVDDSPAEREAVRQLLAEVTVADFPNAPISLPAFGRELASKYFPVFQVTGEDLAKTEAYQAEHVRKISRGKFDDLSDYLLSLQMELDVSPVTDADTARAAQLTQKTNQFNLTARRYTCADLKRMRQTGSWRMFIGALRDRFGDFGQIALCLVRVDEEAADIDVFLMSCRAMGREVETAFLYAVENSLYEEGVRKITSKYVKTRKNIVSKDFWQNNGYKLVMNIPGVFTKRISNNMQYNNFVHINIIK